MPALGVAGTFDRLVTHDGTLMVADLKTGRDVTYGMGEIAIQLALYANAATIYDAATGEHEPMPEVSKTTALVFHLPVGEGECKIYEVDIAAGWEMAQVCGTVRDWRKRKDLGKVIAAASVEPEKVDTPDRTEWIVERIGALKTEHPERVDALREKWDLSGIAKQPPWSDDEITTLSDFLHHVESSWSSPDPANPPLENLAFDVETPPEPPALWDAPDDGPDVSDDDATVLREAVGKLTGEDMDTMRCWVLDAKAQERPWSSGETISERGFAVCRAALRCIRAFPYSGRDARTRAAIAYVLVEDLQPSWRTGAVLGSLSTDQADQLADLADAYLAKDKTARTVIDAAADAA